MTAIEDVAGKVAVVTGGASGIGKGIAHQLVRRGARVVIADVDPAPLERTVAELDVVGVLTDVADLAHVQRLADRTVERFGAVHIVVNNAGVGAAAPVSDLSPADWRWMLDVNLWGVIHGVQVFLPLLEAHGQPAYLINTASMGALVPGPGFGAYVAAKSAVLGLTEVLALELAAAGSKVGAAVLLPGPTRTNIKNSLRSRPVGEVGSLAEVDVASIDRFRGQRWLEPDDVGRLVVEAMGRGDRYIVTHPERWPEVEDRVGRLRAAFNPAISESAAAEPDRRADASY